MDEEGFTRFLKRGGRSLSAVKRCVRHVRDFEAFLGDHRAGRPIEEAANTDIEAYVEWVEREPPASAKTPLWALRYYFLYASMDDQRALASQLRQERIKRTPFPLKNFVDVDPEQVERLAAIGNRSADDMLEAGRTPEGRRHLSEESGIPPEAVPRRRHRYPRKDGGLGPGGDEGDARRVGGAHGIPWNRAPPQGGPILRRVCEDAPEDSGVLESVQGANPVNLPGRISPRFGSPPPSRHPSRR